MSCTTAERWFAPDAEFEALTDDYAFVNEPAEWVRSYFDSYNNQDCFSKDEVDDWAYPIKTFDDVYQFLRLGRKLSIYDNHLIYADVDESDSKHKEALYGPIAKEPALEVESEKARNLRDKMVAKFTQEEVDRKTGRRKHDDKDFLIQKEKRLFEEDLNLDLGILYPEWFSYVMKAADIDEKKELLNIFSGQTKRENPRPVMLLLGMVDKAQTEERGLTEGWNIAYDLVENAILVKPFVSKAGHHPLGGKWAVDTASDGPSFRGTPVEFAKNLIKFSKDMKSKDADAISESDAYTMLVYRHTAKFIFKNSDAFKTVLGSDDKSASDLLEEMDEASIDLNEPMDKKTFEFKQKTPTNGRGINAFRELQSHLQASERELRDNAVNLKKNGNDKLAQECAELYEETLKKLKAFNAK
ncbi:MAG: hypothetical protein Q9214_002364 [Letrouitia sp. 1 TL-2023]